VSLLRDDESRTLHEEHLLPRRDVRFGLDKQTRVGWLVALQDIDHFILSTLNDAERGAADKRGRHDLGGHNRFGVCVREGW
jgi:hypothetical protein